MGASLFSSFGVVLHADIPSACQATETISPYVNDISRQNSLMPGRTLSREGYAGLPDAFPETKKQGGAPCSPLSV